MQKLSDSFLSGINEFMNSAIGGPIL